MLYFSSYFLGNAPPARGAKNRAGDHYVGMVIRDKRLVLIAGFSAIILLFRGRLEGRSRIYGNR